MEKQLIKFDPNKNYSWEPNQNIVISGALFGQILTLSRAILARPESQIALLANETLNRVGDVLKEEVERGNFKEVKEEPPVEEAEVVAEDPQPTVES